MFRVGKAKDANVDETFLVMLMGVEQGLEAGDGSSRLSDNGSQDINMDIGRSEDIRIANEFGEPRLDLRRGCAGSVGIG